MANIHIIIKMCEIVLETNFLSNTQIQTIKTLPITTTVDVVVKMLYGFTDSFRINENIFEIKIDGYTKIWKQTMTDDVLYLLYDSKNNILKKPKKWQYVVTDNNLDCGILSIHTIEQIKNPIDNTTKIVCNKFLSVDQSIHIFIKPLHDRVMNIKCSKFDTIETIKRYIEMEGYMTQDKVRLIFGGRQLENSRTLKDYGIQKGTTIYITCRLRGGMHHISSGIQEIIYKQVNLYYMVDDEIMKKKLKLQFVGDYFEKAKKIVYMMAQIFSSPNYLQSITPTEASEILQMLDVNASQLDTNHLNVLMEKSS